MIWKGTGLPWYALGYFLLADLYNRLGQDALSQEYARKGQEAARTNPPQR